MFALICPVVHLRYLAPALEIKTTETLVKVAKTPH